MRIALNRNLLEEAQPVTFESEWDVAEPTGWETFTVMLHGSEAGDIVEATLDDLRAIVRAFDE